MTETNAGTKKDTSSTTATATGNGTGNKNVLSLGILEEDDEFEEFPVEDWEEGDENKLDIEQWEADWDDDNLDDEFSVTLRKELDRFTAEQAAISK